MERNHRPRTDNDGEAQREYLRRDFERAQSRTLVLHALLGRHVGHSGACGIVDLVDPLAELKHVLLAEEAAPAAELEYCGSQTVSGSLAAWALRVL